MTLEYRCSNCGTLLQTTNADPLIAAAPTMLSVLEMCRHVLKDRDQSEQEVKVYNAVRAVIHLATEPRP